MHVTSIIFLLTGSELASTLKTDWIAPFVSAHTVDGYKLYMNSISYLASSDVHHTCAVIL